MTSTDNREWVDNIIAANGGEDTTHIIEYQNMHDGRTAWKLCRGEKMYYAMETGSLRKLDTRGNTVTDIRGEEDG
jgi:ribosomal protein S6E (S10)